mmetsp:Transcript_23369/g.51297  ORF Transcript_23369/g.51297 Transcript_23369/m.51297 type:complete len:93 (+) Transcript_23369:1487-1765(+)
MHSLAATWAARSLHLLHQWVGAEPVVRPSGTAWRHSEIVQNSSLCAAHLHTSSTPCGLSMEMEPSTNCHKHATTEGTDVHDSWDIVQMRPNK